jgi:hypothetical protein
MTATADSAPAPEMGLLARAIGMITSPRATFERVVATPRPMGILLLVAFVIALAAGLPQFTESARQATLENQVQQNERFMGRAMTEEEYARAERLSHYNPYFAIGGAFIMLPIISLLFAAVYWVVFNTILGGAASFKQVLTIVTHAQVIGALGAALGAPIMYFQNKVSAGGPFNLGALVPGLDPNSALATFLGFTSIFTIWGLIVTAIGLAVLYKRKSRNITIGLLVGYTAIVYTVISVFSSMAGGAAR